MKSAYTITGFSTCGAERAHYNLLAGGLAQRFECVVVSLRDMGTFGKPISELGVPVHTLGIRAGLPEWRLRASTQGEAIP